VIGEGTDVRGRRALVTGAAGFVGSHLLAALACAGAEVAGLEKPGASWRRLEMLEYTDSVQRLEADLTSPGAFLDAVKEWKPDVIFHLAAYGVRAQQSNPQLMASVNTVAGFEVARAAAEHGVQRLVWMGSGFEYTPNQPEAMDETTSTAPENLYGASKLAGLELARFIARTTALELSVLRLFSTFGPAEHPSRLIPYVILSALRGQDIEMTQGDQERDYLMVEDVAQALMTVATNPDAAGGVFNAGSGEPLTVRDLVRTIVYRMGDPVPVHVGARPMARPEPKRFVADATRLQRLGWSPSYTLQAGIERTIAWYRSHLDQVHELP